MYRFLQKFFMFSRLSRAPLLALAYTCVSHSAAVYAQSSLDEVIVSASKGSSSLRDTPAAVSKIGQAVLAEKKPTFVGQVLNQAAGVYVTDLGNEQHNMSIRQPLSYNALYLYMEDGIPIRPAGLFNHNALYEINLAGTGDIEVMKGPASALYGSNAAGGAVNFLTRAPSAQPQAMLGVQSSDQGYRRWDFDASGPVGEGGLRVAGYQSTRRGGWQRYNNADKDSLSLRHDAPVADAALLKTILSYNRLYTDMPGSLNESDYQQRPGFSYQNFTWRKVEAARLSTELEGRWNAGGVSTITAYARSNTTDQLPSYLIFNTSATTAVGRTTAQHFDSLGLDAHHKQSWGDAASVLLGLSLDSSPMQAQERNLAVVRDAASGSYTSFTRRPIGASPRSGNCKRVGAMTRCAMPIATA
jgi:outer membrane receptor protein involved in Fe transport